MNKTKYFCDIMNAYLKGKVIQYQDETGEWVDCDNPEWDFNKNYRIKDDIKPFENINECFEEMQKHHPVGWLRSKVSGDYAHVNYINNCLKLVNMSYYNITKTYSMKECLDLFEFTDGTPFGKDDY